MENKQSSGKDSGKEDRELRTLAGTDIRGAKGKKGRKKDEKE